MFFVASPNARILQGARACAFHRRSGCRGPDEGYATGDDGIWWEISAYIYNYIIYTYVYIVALCGYNMVFYYFYGMSYGISPTIWDRLVPKMGIPQELDGSPILGNLHTYMHTCMHIHIYIYMIIYVWLYI